MKKTLTLLFVGSLIVASPFASKADSPKEIIKYIVSKAKDYTSKSKAQEKLCKKASFFGMKYSLRSLEGIACKEKNVAAIALTLCKGYQDFGDSQCYKNASKIFPDDTSRKEMLVTVVKSNANNLRIVVCTISPFIPTAGTAVATACVVAGAAASVAGA